MQIESLKVFVDIARYGSFSKAARHSGITQSMASQTVRALEKHLGLQLIDRSCRPWTLTPEGKTYAEGLRKIVEKYNDLEAEVRGLETEASPVVRVGSIYSVGLHHMKEYIQKFIAIYARARIDLDYLHPQKVIWNILHEAIDIGLVSFAKSSKDIAVIPWQMEPMVLVCHPDHPLAKRKTVPVDAINGESYVHFDEDLVIRRQVDRYLKRHRTGVDVVLEFDNIESIKRAVEIASGVAILPRPVLDNELRLKTLAAVAFDDKSFMRPLGIVHRRGKKFTPMVENFVTFLQAAARKN